MSPRVLIAFTLLTSFPGFALANPDGGVVQGGIATITGQGTAQVDVHQASQGASLSWQSFNIAPGEVTNFHQPNASAVAINRILQQDPSQIFGALNANGNVYLINPNGFLFGASAKINTRGFTATTSAEDLVKLGGYDASATAAPGAKIENHGSITTGDGGFVYLIAPRVENGEDAVITTPGGEILLAAGATVTLTDDPSGIGAGIEYTAPGRPGGAAVNLGRLVANGGFARMRADLVRQGGVVQANAVRERAGKIELYATNQLTLESGSLTDASGGTEKGEGGEVFAYSEGDAAMHAGAVVDVSGGREGGDAGEGEVSSKEALALAGTFRAGARTGSTAGKILIDPTVLTIDDQTRFVGAGSVVAEATDRIEIATGATVQLSNDSQYGDGTASRQSLTLRSGRHISFGSGSRIVDDGTGAGGRKVWDVNLVAGADLASADLLATQPTSDGSVYLSGGTFAASGGLTSLGSGNGEVALTHGDLRVRAPGDVVIGNGGGLKNETGGIDVAVGRDVRFRAGSQTQDGVIENGSGDIHVRAGRDVLLVENANVRGNAAIRTRGVVGTDPDGHTTLSDGGSITIEAGRDVDSGIGNRWLEPGPNLSRRAYQDLARELGLPPDFVVPDFDPMPVVREGILGIGTEAGGDVTIVAGNAVRTGISTQPRSGATAAQLGTQYNGSHIGVFGRPVARVTDPVFGGERNVPIDGAPESRLIVVAGNTIEGEYTVRYGEAHLRAGQSLASGVDARSLAPSNFATSLVDSAAALLDPRSGWFGTLERPVTVDSMQASVFGFGRNGIALRGIENPSLVYPPNSSSSGVYAVSTWRPTDGATLRSSHGSVYLIGNDITLPTAESATPQSNQLVRLLPPNVRIETDRGDLVLLNDFTLHPSTRGGLDLQIAGKVRTAGFSASSAAVLSLSVETLGATGDVRFTIPAGTRVRDPLTGLEYTLTSEVTVGARTPAQATVGSVTFRVAPDAVNGRVVVPSGTRVATSDGRVYRVLQDAVLLPPQQRFSEGNATFFAAQGGATSAIAIASGTILTDANGARFAVTQDGTILPGRTQITVSVRALTAGVDAPAGALSLVTPIAGISRATNLAGTVRPTEITARVQAIEAGADGNAFRFGVTAILDPVPGVAGVINRGPLSGGANIAPTGVGKILPTTLGDDPIARAGVLGPVGELAAGTRLVLSDPRFLPANVRADEISIVVGAVAINAAATPSLYRSLRSDDQGRWRADPAAGTVETLPATEIWARDGSGTSARILQSDAHPDVDARTVSGAFNYGSYFGTCRAGVACQQGLFGLGPTHSGDPARSILRALGGFERVAIELAKAAFALTGDAGIDGVFGTSDDGSDGSILDFSLITQHTSASDETRIWVPIGNASFGAVSPAPGVLPDLLSGLQVAGPGSAAVLVGVLPNAPQVDRNANGRIDPEESAGDRDGNGSVDRSEWLGSDAVFTGIDESQRVFLPGDVGPIFAERLIVTGTGDGTLSAAETPYVPSGRGGTIQMAAAIPVDRAPLSLGISAIGNVRRTQGLPVGSASLTVAAAGDVALGGRGSIETYQGSRLVVQSVGGAVRGGTPPAGFSGRRGIVTLNRGPGFGDAPIVPFGGGDIGVDAHADIDVGGLALAALSGSDIDGYTRAGSIDAGTSTPFEDPRVFVDPSGTVLVSYQGGGVFGRDINLQAKQDIRIGAGITGNNINLGALGSVTSSGGGGSVSASGSLNISAGSNISGSFSASGSISIGGGSVSQGSSLSAGGLVAGAGSGVASNTSGGKVSSELSQLTGQAAEVGAAGFQTASAAATGSRGVRIQVTSRVIEEDEE